MHEDRRTQDCVAEASSRPPTHELVRQHARMLRDRAHAFEKLADELERHSYTTESDDLLWQLLVHGFNTRL